MTPEQELLGELRRRFSDADIKIEATSTSHFNSLEKTYPISGSSIDWRLVRGAIERRIDTLDWGEYFVQAKTLAEEVWTEHKFDRAGSVIVIGDSAMQCALTMSLGTLSSCLREILSMPQHTYIVDSDGKWCMVFSMAGDVSFGFAPSDPARS